MLSTKKIFSFWTLIFISAIFSFLTAGELKVVKNSLSGINSFQGKFKQVYFDSLLNRVQNSSGKVKYLKPGMMIWDYAAPEELKIVIGKKKIWIYDPLLENVTMQNIDTVTRVEILSFFFQQEQLKDHFKEIDPEKRYIEDSKNGKVLYLAPISENPSFKEIQLQIDEKNNAITRFAILEHNNNYRIVSLSGLVYNQIKDENQFNFKIPDGVEVIDGVNN